MTRGQSQRRWTQVLLGLTGSILAVSAGYGLYSMQTSHRQLQQARADLIESQRLVDDIERLRQQPRIASLEVEPPSQIADRVSSALRAAGLPATILVRVAPQPAVRIGRSPYLLRATDIELQDAPMEGVVRFAHHLGDVEQGMTVRDLTLSEATTESVNQELWVAEITLTQMIFSPTIP